ncbi:MAG: hypothetical protein IPK79_04925 [Vampirovibrionales bacterium]|nr:hypothetical protein [Vampirovibrionales bacterium]
MVTATEIQDATVEALFQDLERSGVRYALLRNYERFPQFGHDIDLVMAAEDMAPWRDVARAVARRFEWDALTECRHWAQSREPLHRVHVFRFYRRAPMAFLEVDLFHGYSLWGLPLAGEAAVLAGRRPDAAGRFTHVDPCDEHGAHMLQMRRLMRFAQTEAKLARYRDKILRFYEANPDAFNQWLLRFYGPAGVKALRALMEGDFRAFGQRMSQTQRDVLRRRFARAPLRSARQMLARAVDLAWTYGRNPCGFVLPVDAPLQSDRASLLTALEALARTNVLIGFTAQRAHRRGLSWGERQLMERGGAVIKWTKSGAPGAFCVDPGEPQDGLAQRLLQRCMDRHPPIWTRSSP